MTVAAGAGRKALLSMAILAGVSGLAGAQAHPARGMVTAVGTGQQPLEISCEAIPGFMDAMEMSFTVRDPKVLATLRPGMTVQFNMVEERRELYADDIHIGTSSDFGSEQMSAGSLTALQDAIDPASKENVVQPGHPVPDFALTDQAGKSVRLSALRGKVVVLTFGYSRCPFPQYCLRLSNNLAMLEERFSGRAGRDLVLLTIAIDPQHDQGKALSGYAASFRANPADWHFLTGPLPAVKQVAAMFGMNFWPAEGRLTHSLHTAVLDRSGILVANIDGSEFSAQQLGDLAEQVMNRSQ
ncbi:MAG TPA: SCO family protein [Acidobacteriaceae bacterium]